VKCQQLTSCSTAWCRSDSMTRDVCLCCCMCASCIHARRYEEVELLVEGPTSTLDDVCFSVKLSVLFRRIWVVRLRCLGKHFQMSHVCAVHVRMLLPGTRRSSCLLKGCPIWTSSSCRQGPDMKQGTAQTTQQSHHYGKQAVISCYDC
jgi:hypothetical protein